MKKTINFQRIKKPCLSKMNKKAQLSYDVSMFIIKLILVAMIISFVMLVIYQLVVNDVGVEHLRAQLFIERALAAPGCLSYYDESINRNYPNIIDVDKFNKKDILKECINYGDKEFISAKLTLKNLESGKEDIIYYNKDAYEKWEPFSFDERVYLKVDRQRYVLIKDNGKTNKGKLKIEVLTPTG